MDGVDVFRLESVRAVLEPAEVGEVDSADVGHLVGVSTHQVQIDESSHC